MQSSTVTSVSGSRTPGTIHLLSFINSSTVIPAASANVMAIPGNLEVHVARQWLRIASGIGELNLHVHTALGAVSDDGQTSPWYPSDDVAQRRNARTALTASPCVCLPARITLAVEKIRSLPWRFVVILVWLNGEDGSFVASMLIFGRVGSRFGSGRHPSIVATCTDRGVS